MKTKNRKSLVTAVAFAMLAPNVGRAMPICLPNNKLTEIESKVNKSPSKKKEKKDI